MITGFWACKEVDQTKVCEIEDLTIVKGDCTSDSTYILTLDFKVVNTVADSFVLNLRNNEKISVYRVNQLPLKIKHFPKLGKDYDDVKVCMLGEKECCKEIEFKSPNCDDDPCEIYDLVADVGKCNTDSTYNLWIDFEVENAGKEYFELYNRKNKLIRTSKISQLPLKLENFKRSGKDYDYLKVCINDNENYCKEIEFKPPKCGCKLTELELTAGDCTSDSTYKLTTDFEYKNVKNYYFEVFVRNNKRVGYYKFKDYPLQ